MKRWMLRALSLAAALVMAAPSAMAAKSAKATPTPPPVEISEEVQDELPEQIRQMLDIAYAEWENLGGKKLNKVNKYTEWRGKGIGFGWCGGYITWCMMQAGIPMEELEAVKRAGERDVEGVVHVKEASVGKLLRGYQLMHRSTNIPQKGFLVVYGEISYNKTVHIGLVYDVEKLGEGRYRLTTLEGNMSGTVRMYVHDYDMTAPDPLKNISSPPREEQTRETSRMFTYDVPKGQNKKSYWINCFLMPWIPGDMLNPAPTVTPAP